MKYAIIILLLSFSASAVKAQEMQIQNYDQVRLTAIQDFSKTKLFKKDSVFNVRLYDTLYRVAVDTIDKYHYRSKRGRPYPDIIAVCIIGFSWKYFLDTTSDLSSQKGIPSRFIEQNGKLFIWYDDHYPLIDNTIKMLVKYHLIVRGGRNDWISYTDDSKQAADYYFCRSNLSVFKKVITNRATGDYEPPNLNCK